MKNTDLNSPRRFVRLDVIKADQSVAAYVEDEWSGAGEASSKRRSNCYGKEGYDSDNETPMRDVNLKTEENKKPKPNKVSLPEAAAKIDPWDLAASLVKISKSYAFKPEEQLLKFVDYLEIRLSAVQYPWLNMFKESPCPKLIDMIAVPLSHIPEPVYKTSVEWLDKFSIGLLCAFVVWSLNRLLTILEPPQQGGHQRRTTSKFHVAIFVALAMVLRNEPNTLVIVLPTLKEDEYQGHDKLPILVWMMAQASQGDLSVGLYSWSCNLLPVFYQENLLPVARSNPQSMDLILQLVEMILSNLDARTILVNGTVIDKQRLISPYAFELLMRLTFPASSERVKATERFEAIYPLLKEVALACEPGSELMKQVTQQIFHYSLIIAGRRNPVLAKEATAIAIWSLTENVDCCKQWEKLCCENKEASVAVLKNLVDEWNAISLKLASSPSHKSNLRQTMETIRLKNEEAITKGGAIGSLYKEADKSCKVISGRLFRESSCLKGKTIITAVVLAAVAVLVSNM